MTNKQQMASEHGSTHETICLLGEGGMARVFLGFTRGPANVHKLVVMKEIRSELARDQRFVTMFLDEARIATRLNHPNVVHTYSVLEEDGKYTLIMEYLDGQTLFDILQRIDLQYFPLEEHVWILTQVLAALEYAHSLTDYDGTPLGLVHRDVSPGNTFVTYGGVVKLLDFGIAKARGAVSVTQKGDFKGKLNYCAPEQIEPDTPPDARTDLFAVGVMLWEALARRRIASDGSYLQLAQTRLTGREPKIRKICPDVPATLAAICDRAMALKPADRYLTATDFQRDLERYLGSTGRQVGRAQVAELMHRHFLQEQRDMQRRIEEHLRGIRDVSIVSSLPGKEDSYADILPMGVIRAPSSRPTTSPTLATSVSERSHDFAEMRTEEAMPPAAFWQGKPFLPDLPESLLPAADVPPPHATPSKRWVTPRVLALLGLLAGTTAAAVTLWRIDARKSEAVPRPPMVSLPSQNTTRVPGPVVEPLTDTTTPATIQLDVTVSPSNATLTLDGKAIDGNRLQTDVPKDEQTHVIGAFSPGYLPFYQRVAFSSDVRLTIQLKGERGVPTKKQARRGKPGVIRSQDSGPPEEEPTVKQGSEIIDDANPYAW